MTFLINLILKVYKILLLSLVMKSPYPRMFVPFNMLDSNLTILAVG